MKKADIFIRFPHILIKFVENAINQKVNLNSATL